MRIAVFSSQPYDRSYLSHAAEGSVCELLYLEPRLTGETVAIAAGNDAVCCFVNDVLDRDVLEQLAGLGIRLILLRCAGFNNVDLRAASEFGLTVMRVPEYSPDAVAEHTIALALCVIRRLHRAWGRVREGDFRLDGLMGFDLAGKTVGVVGTGRIGSCVARIFRGLGCRVIACDTFRNPELISLNIEYVDLDQLFCESRIITLHCPLTPETKHLINEQTLSRMPEGVVLVNTSRGALVDTQALINSLKAGHVKGVALDVYEEEASLFFNDHSSTTITDDVFARLLTFPNVLITGHQGFFTHEALTQIAGTTVQNAVSFLSGSPLKANVVS